MGETPNARFDRRLATIACVDVCGYSLLMGLDEDGTLSRFKAQTAFAEERASIFGGRLFGAAGDSFMLEFSSPVDAVRCALDIQQGIGARNAALPGNLQMLFRIGINHGDVMVDGDRLVGDDVNIAARLQETAAAGGIVVSETVRFHLTGKLNVGYRYLGERRFKNIVPTVRCYRLYTSPREEEEALAERSVLGAASRRASLSFEGRPAIAVLPFQNLGEDTRQEYLADGLTDDLITGLSQLRWLPVIARGSSFMFRDKPVGDVAIGAALGARYLVEGSVLVAGQKARITAQLTDASPERGTVMWRERYERDLSDILRVLDEIARQVVATLEAQIERAEQHRSSVKPRDQLDTWDLVRRGAWHQTRLTREDALLARQLFLEAIEREPRSLEAHLHLWWWHFWALWTQRGPRELLDEMRRLARLALSLDPTDGRSHMASGITRLMAGDPVGARAALQEAVKLNPSLMVARTSLGSSYLLAGDPESSIDHFLSGMSLSPHEPYLFHPAGELAAAYHLLERWEDALQWCEKSLSLRPGYWYPRVVRIGTLARMGDLRAAAAELNELRARRRNFTAKHVRWLPFTDKRWNEYFIHGLELAGYDATANV